MCLKDSNVTLAMRKYKVKIIIKNDCIMVYLSD